MFNGCSSLKSLNLSHFNLDLTNNFDNMFIDCKENLIYLMAQIKLKFLNKNFYFKNKS